MNASTFDPDSFLDSTVNSNLSTQPKLCDQGEHEAVIEKVTAETTPSGRVTLKVHWRPDGWPGFPIRQTVWLDLDDNGKIDSTEGANYQLGRLLEAVGQLGKKGWKPNDLVGGRALVMVDHVPSKDGTAIYDNVTRVSAL